LNSNKPLIVITTGDPRGVGPEITEKSLKQKAISRKADYIVIDETRRMPEKKMSSLKAGRRSIENIKKAVKILMASRRKKALVTAPINKHAVYKTGCVIGGHTEMLAKFTGSKRVAMMFTADHFRLALVTRHIPLKKVAGVISVEKVVSTSRLFFDALKTLFGIKKPLIGIAGINPHAGDLGAIGNEEKKVIFPAIRKLKSMGIRVHGPCPADVLFYKLYKRKLDGVISMYHDQGLAPFKMLYFEKGVNLTLGLPFPRTSPDHGTAFDIAGKGIANSESMEEAIKLAVRLASMS